MHAEEDIMLSETSLLETDKYLSDLPGMAKFVGSESGC